MMKKNPTAVSKVKRIIGAAGRLIFPDIWLVSDRPSAGGDNGEALFLYLSGQRKHVYFVLDKKSPDFERLKKYGNVLAYRSLKYYLFCCVARVDISSHREKRCPDSLDVFLQHGITMNDMHVFFNALYHDRLYITSSAEEEYQKFLGEAYEIPKDHLWLTGPARFDLLENRDDKLICICFTWRTSFDVSSGTHEARREGFKNSDYFKALHKITHDQKLKKELTLRGYRLCVRLHPMIKDLEDVLELDEDVMLYDRSYRDMFAESSLLVTDYSSIVYDFSYLEKPVIYYQFDHGAIFENHSYERGDYDYVRDGFGPVVEEYDTLCQQVIDYVHKNCQMEEKYRERVSEFFTFRDGKNRERIYRHILQQLGES